MEIINRMISPVQRDATEEAIVALEATNASLYETLQQSLEARRADRAHFQKVILRRIGDEHKLMEQISTLESQHIAMLAKLNTAKRETPEAIIETRRENDDLRAKLSEAESKRERLDRLLGMTTAALIKREQKIAMLGDDVSELNERIVQLTGALEREQVGHYKKIVSERDAQALVCTLQDQLKQTRDELALARVLPHTQ